MANGKTVLVFGRGEMKPDYSCRGQTDRAQAWYDNLDFFEKEAVDKKIRNAQAYIKSKSGQVKFGKKSGIELVYSVRERIL